MSGGIVLSESLETALRHGAAVRAMTLAGFTVLTYDHILTFSQEVELIWKAPFGRVSILFLLNRYLVPLMLIVDIYEFFGVADDSAMFCRVWTCLQSFLTVASFMSIHIIVALRIHALHSGRRLVKRLLLVGGMLYFTSSTSIVITAQVQLIPNLQPTHRACVGKIPWYLWTVWLPSVLFESFLFALTLSAMLHNDRRRFVNTLSHILYRDGMLYFIVVSICSLFSLFVWALAQPTLLGLARYFALAVVNVAGSRMVLNLKSYAASRSPSLYTTSRGNTSTIQFPAQLSRVRVGDRFGAEIAHPKPSYDVELYTLKRGQQPGAQGTHQYNPYV